VTEDEFHAMVESTKRSHYHWRDATMLMLMFYHGLRVSERCHLQRN
jgi:integrase